MAIDQSAKLIFKSGLHNLDLITNAETKFDDMSFGMSQEAKIVASEAHHAWS